MSKEQIGEDIEIENFILTYFITKSKIICEGEEYITYGIEIEKKSLSKVEMSKIEDITSDKLKIKEIANIIKDNIVTPVHLYDVMENFL